MNIFKQTHYSDFCLNKLIGKTRGIYNTKRLPSWYCNGYGVVSSITVESNQRQCNVCFPLLPYKHIALRNKIKDIMVLLQVCSI